jgi:hypothetical protein
MKQTMRPRLHIPSPRWPVWRARNLTLLSIFAVAATATIVLILGHRSIVTELEIALAIIAAATFTFFSAGLYQGLRLEGPEVTVDEADGRALEFPDVNAWIVDDGWFIGIMLWLLASILWILTNLFAVGVFWVFNRALRLVFACSPSCHGRLAPSLGYALLYTCLYTGWLFALLWGMQLVARR